MYLPISNSCTYIFSCPSFHPYYKRCCTYSYIFPCLGTASITSQSRRVLPPTTSSPSPVVVASAPYPPITTPSISSVPSPLLRIIPLLEPSPLSMPCRIYDSLIQEGLQRCHDGGDAQSNIKDNDLPLRHALPMISPYGLG